MLVMVKFGVGIVKPRAALVKLSPVKYGSVLVKLSLVQSRWS